MIRCQVVIAVFLAMVGCQSMRGKKSPDFIEPLALQQNASSVKAAFPKNERELCIRTASTVADSGHVTEAIALYENAEQLDVNADPLDRELAPLYALSNQAELSITRYQRAIEMNPDDAELRNNFVWTLLEFDRIEQAGAAVNLALKRFPDHRRLQSTQALALYRQGKRSAALEQFATLYGRSAAHHNLALLDIESGDEIAAKSEVKQALAHEPSGTTIQLASAIEGTSD